MIGYYGGKTWLGKKLNNLPIPKKEGFIDVFTGGGSMTDWAYPRYNKLVINDIDTNLILFYKYCKEDPDGVIAEVEKVRQRTLEDTHCLKCKELKEVAKGDYPDIVKAAYVYVGSKTAFGAKVYDCPTQEHILEFNKQNHKQIIYNLRRTLVKCEINNLDYKDLLDKYKDKDYLCYFDPPYFRVADNNYYGVNGENHKGFDHYELLDIIKQQDKLGKQFMISYEWSDEIREMYKGFNHFKIEKITTAASDDYNVKKYTPEILITNFELKQIKKRYLI